MFIVEGCLFVVSEIDICESSHRNLENRFVGCFLANDSLRTERTYRIFLLSFHIAFAADFSVQRGAMRKARRFPRYI
jgi:hypothetical protein